MLVAISHVLAGLSRVCVGSCREGRTVQVHTCLGDYQAKSGFTSLTNLVCCSPFTHSVVKLLPDHYRRLCLIPPTLTLVSRTTEQEDL